MEHIKEFSKQANSYNEYSQIQKEVAKYLLSKVKMAPKNILDLGCGTGHIYQNISWQIEKFIAVDSAKEMLEKHFVGESVETLCLDFESQEFKKEMLKRGPFDMIVSSSTLQWAKKLDNLLEFLQTISNNIAFSIFTDKTFKTLYETASLSSFLPSETFLIKTISKYFDIEYDTRSFKLHFCDTKSLFRYIKKSGVSGGKRKLNYRQTKELMKNYPSNYLEFEVIFIVGKKAKW